MTIPSGWYLVASAGELAAGTVIRKHLFDQNLALWRTESGQFHVSDSVCPHLGSDLSTMGKVQGETLVCPSHSFRFDGEGNCLSSMFAGLPTRSKGVLKSWPTREIGGLCFAYYDAQGGAPSWQLPEHYFQTQGKRHFIRSQYTFDVGVDIINEDNFDLGHFYQYHEIYDVVPLGVSTQDHMIKVRYDFKRHSILFKSKLPGPLQLLSKEVVGNFGSELYGPGFTFFDLNLPLFDFHLDYFVFPTPITADRTLYTTYLRRDILKDGDRLRPLERVGKNLFHDIILGMSLHRLRGEHRTEGPAYWETKSRVADPVLGEEEVGLITPYRTWCQQFESRESPAGAAAERTVTGGIAC